MTYNGARAIAKKMAVWTRKSYLVERRKGKLVIREEKRRG